VPEARARGYQPGGFNVRGGRCEACKGRRYNRETLDVAYKGKNIAEVLDMTVEDAAVFLVLSRYSSANSTP
jgi:excinuclease ABC subunit A